MPHRPLGKANQMPKRSFRPCPWQSSALSILLGALLWGSAAESQTLATPRAGDGHPDLSGFWVPGGAASRFLANADNMTYGGRSNTFRGFEEDGALLRMDDPNRPIYRPDFWQEIRENDYNGNWLDPQQACMPPGVPRIGAPARIVQLPNEILLFYNGGFSRDLVRSVPTDGRGHNEINVALKSWNGDSVGHWEGESLVIESVGFTDASWLHKNGYPHGFQLRVTERLTRNGNLLLFEEIVEDQEYLSEPWAMTPVLRQLNVYPEDGWLAETPPCQERDRDHIVSHARSGY